MDLAAVNADLIEALADGEMASVTVGGVVKPPFPAAFRSPWMGETVAGVTANRPSPELLASPADWAATGAENGARLTFRGVDYIVADAQLDDDGGMTLYLSGAPA